MTGGLAVKRILELAAILAAACAAGKGDGAQAGAGPGRAYEPPVVMYRVLDPGSPHPTVRIPLDTARELGVFESALATPDMIDRLEASCAGSNQAAQCRHELRPCHDRTCRIVALH